MATLKIGGNLPTVEQQAAIVERLGLGGVVTLTPTGLKKDGVDLTPTDEATYRAEIGVDETVFEDAVAMSQAARDAAFINANVYADEPTGRAAVADNVQFQVVSVDGLTISRYKRVNSGSSTLVATYPSKKSFDKEAANTRINYAQKDNGKNLCNPNDQNAKFGAFLGNSGGYTTNAGYSVTGYIPITDGQSLTCSSTSGGAYNALYDENLVLVSSFQFNSTLVGTSISKYARFSVNKTSLATVQVESGSSATTFEAYTATNQIIQEIKTVKADLADVTNDVLFKLDKIPGKNLFNKNDPNIIVDHYITSTGTFAPTGYGINVSGKLPISSGQTLKANFSVGNTFVALYNSSDVYIAGSAVNATSISYMAGAAYARFSYYTPWFNNQVEIGTVSTPYEAFSEFGPLITIGRKLPDRDPVVVLPSKMYFVKGLESNIYYENILFKNLGEPVQAHFNIGSNYSRQVRIQPAAALTNGAFTAQVVCNFKLGELRTISYDIKDPVLNAGKTVNILYVGDSFTDIGAWNKRVTTLLRADGVTVNELGTTGNSTFKAEGLSGGNILNTFLNSSAGVARIVSVTGVVTVPSTGYPGAVYSDANNAQWAIRGGKVDGSGNGKLVVTKFGAVTGDFASFPSSGVLTKISGTGDATINYSSPVSAYYNPFINHTTGVLDISHYVTYWEFNEPNAVVFQFTWNDTGNWDTDEGLATDIINFKAAADHVHAEYPTAKVIFSIEPPGSLNGNREFNGKKYTVLRFVELLKIAFEDDVAYSSWVKLAPSYAFVDLVYGYSGATVVPCAKYPTVIEQSGGDGVHPRTEGMEQIGECVYQVVSNLI